MTPRESVVSVLAGAVGVERAEELVSERARTLFGTIDFSSEAEALALLRSFGEDAGVVGASARLAIRRRGQSTTEPTGETFTLDDIAQLFTSAVGEEKAKASVREAAARLAITEPCRREQVTRVLEALAKTEGLVGVTARFAKARFLLRSS